MATFLPVGCRGQCSVTGCVGWGWDRRRLSRITHPLPLVGFLKKSIHLIFLSRERERLKIEFMGLSPYLTHTYAHAKALPRCQPLGAVWSYVTSSVEQRPSGSCEVDACEQGRVIFLLLSRQRRLCCIFLVSHCIVSGLLARSCQILTALHESIHGSPKRNTHRGILPS